MQASTPTLADLCTVIRPGLDRPAFAREVSGLGLDGWQEDLLSSTSRRVLLNIARQIGKSTTAGWIALHRALFHPGSLVLCLAPSERQSKELFAKITLGYQSFAGTPPESDRKLGMQLSNGSRIEALPGSEKTVRGFSGVDLLILDEASRIDDGLYHATRPMLSVSGGSLIMLSTPNGKRGVFYREWSEGEGWERYDVTAEECPRISPEFLEEERRTLPERMFLQEYMCKFLDVEDQLFSTDLVSSAITSEVTPLFGEVA